MTKRTADVLKMKDGMLFLGGNRMLVLNHDYTLAMYTSLRKLVGPVAKTILYTSAKNAASTFIEPLLKEKIIKKVLLKTELGQKKAIETVLAKFYVLTGLGLVKLISFSKEEIIIRSWNCSFSNDKGIEDLDEIGCLTNRAIIEGAISTLLNKPYKAKETKCVLWGNKYCEIHLTLGKKNDK